MVIRPDEPDRLRRTVTDIDVQELVVYGALRMRYRRVITLIGFALGLGCAGWPGCRSSEDSKQVRPKSQGAASSPVDRNPSPVEPTKRPVKRSTRPAITQCARVCNHQQQCGQSRGGVADCITACLEVLKSDDGRGVLAEAVLLRARSKCGDAPCGDSSTCIMIALVGKERVAASKPVADNKAQAMCAELCNKQETCDQASFARKPGGMNGCLSQCRQVLRGTTEKMAAARITMAAAYACRSESCETFDQCRKKQVIGR